MQLPEELDAERLNRAGLDSLHEKIFPRSLPEHELELADGRTVVDAGASTPKQV